MVAIARYLNVTLIVPELDKTSFWADPSEFKDIFDVDHFITSLRNEMMAVLALPPTLLREFSQFGDIDSVRIWSVPIVNSKTPRKGAIIKKQVNDSVDRFQLLYLNFQN